MQCLEELFAKGFVYNVTCDFVIVFIVLVQDIAFAKCQRATIQNKCTAFCFCSQVSKTTSNVLNCYKVNRCGMNKKVATITMRPNVTISASCGCSVAIFTTSLESQESCLTLRNLTLQITRDFLRLHNTFARLYNAAASPSSHLCLVGLLAIIT